jgi:hypothetical protein
MLALLMVSSFVAHADVGPPPAQVSPAAVLPEAPTAMAGITGAAFSVTNYCVSGGDCGSPWGFGGVGTLGADLPVGEAVAVRAQAFGATADSTRVAGMVVSLRGPMVEQPGLVISPWIAAGMGVFGGDLTSAGLAGVAFDAGSETVRVDASLPLVGALKEAGMRAEPFVLLPVAVIGELGVRWAVGERSSLRAGMLGFLPGVDWQRQIGDDGKLLQIGVHGLGVANTLRLGFSQPL